jgi:8-oxo-dGTP pyrophosphatase MutT (NUDIX family)
MATQPPQSGVTGPTATSTFLDQDTWFAQLPGVVMSAAALITDPAERVLLVKPNYRDHWSLPGGICEYGESPHEGCAREVAEEIGLDRPFSTLLAVEWTQPYGVKARPIINFVFDGGSLADGSGIVLQASELDDFRFTAADEVADYLAPFGVRRVKAALAARASGGAIYGPTWTA